MNRKEFIFTYEVGPFFLFTDFIEHVYTICAIGDDIFGPGHYFVTGDEKWDTENGQINEVKIYLEYIDDLEDSIEIKKRLGLLEKNK